MQEREGSLEELDISNNGLTGEAADAVAQLLSASPGLRSLNLNMNELGDGGMYPLAKALKGVSEGGEGGLTELDVGACAFGEEGAAVLMDALRGSTTLESLVLSCVFLNCL